nr:uncharacterized protein LOC109187414 [Ipomoea batatas]
MKIIVYDVTGRHMQINVNYTKLSMHAFGTKRTYSPKPSAALCVSASRPSPTQPTTAGNHRRDDDRPTLPSAAPPSTFTHRLPSAFAHRLRTSTATLAACTVMLYCRIFLSPDSVMLSPEWDYSNRIAAAAGYSPTEEGAAELEEATIF